MTSSSLQNRSNPYDYLKTSPMFKLSLSSKELFHSNFLEWLSCVDPDAFKKMINQMADLGEDYDWPEVWRVKREFLNFDLCVVAYDKYTQDDDERIEDDPDFRLLFVLENKVKSIPYQEQLQDYTIKAKGFNHKYWAKVAKAQVQSILQGIKRDDIVFRLNKDSDAWVISKKDNGKRGKWEVCERIDSECTNLPVDYDPSCIIKIKGINGYSSDYAEKKMKDLSIHFILLSLAKSFPNCPSNARTIDTPISWDIGWKLNYYEQYQQLILKHFKSIEGLQKDIIVDYCNFVKCLCALSNDWSKDYSGNSPFLYFTKDKANKKVLSDNYNLAHHYRIHDLYQKLKFSFICTRLFEDIKKEYSEWTVFPNNQGGLFKDGNFTDNGGKLVNKYICVNYTYLHGEPLIEINIRPEKCGLYYAIQVQGDVYEHGIQVKADKRKGKVIPILAEEVWEKLQIKHPGKKYYHLPDGWMSIPNRMTWNAQCGILENKGSADQFSYNKYDMSNGTFVYQSKLIKVKAIIDDVLILMKDDLKTVVQSLK